jgi:hypothetical protein
VVLVLFPVSGLSKNAVVHGVGVKSNIRYQDRHPAITDESSVGIDPSTDNVRQDVGISLPHGNTKYSTGHAFDPAQHTLALNRVSPTVFSPTEFALIDLKSLVRIAELFEAALQYPSSVSLQNKPQSAIVRSVT